MINIEELLKRYAEYSQSGEEHSFIEFIHWLDEEQKKKQKAGVISLDKREGARRLKELRERQEKNKVVTPEEDFKNIKD